MILTKEAIDRFCIESKSLRSLEKFLIYLDEEKKLDGHFTFEFLNKFLSKSRILELINMNILCSIDNSFYFSKSFLNLLAVTEDNSNSEPNEVSAVSGEEGEEETMDEHKNSHVNVLLDRQFVSLVRNLKISEQDLIVKLKDNKELLRTFGFNKQWLELKEASLEEKVSSV